MIIESYTEKGRINKRVKLNADLVITGGGMAGSCAAITAAREGLKVALVQDRPVLGGNASSEVRLWILGATSHMGNNNRWAREGGVIDEVLVENLYRNKEGNPLIFDTIMLEKVHEEPNIQLLLNTVVHEVNKKDSRNIESVKAFCSQNSTEYMLHAPLFCDASGDGIVSFLAGASFRMGAENKEEFGELFAPDKSFGELLGHSLYFYSKKTEQPVKYIAPSYALKDISEITKYRIVSKDDQGCRFWWIEFGGRKDTIYDTESIKWELWKVIYGIWNHIKNSGEYEDVDNLTLEWVGTIPGKRESRRFEGLYILKQQDIVEQTVFPDAVAYGGWALDLHPADGVYSNLPGCVQYHSKGIYTIPLRSFISKDIDNLLYAGRIISASHVAFGSSRVMGTCAYGGQSVALAACQCVEKQIKPSELLQNGNIEKLQHKLYASGQGIPGVPISNSTNLLSQATINASSTCKLSLLPGNDTWFDLDIGMAQLLPLEKDIAYTFTFNVSAMNDTALQIELRTSTQLGSYTPDQVHEVIKIPLKKGTQKVEAGFQTQLDADQYAFITLIKNNDVKVLCSEERLSGIVSVFNGKNKAVNNNGKQTPPEGSGIDSFEFWIPMRRPKGHNLAFSVHPALQPYKANYLNNGCTRPYLRTNAWAADCADEKPGIHFLWEKQQSISEITLFFDTDYDHAMESVLMGHPEDVIPFVVRDYDIFDASGNNLHSMRDNYQSINKVRFDKPIETNQLEIRFKKKGANIPIALFEVIVK